MSTIENPNFPVSEVECSGLRGVCLAAMTTDISVGVRWDPLNGQPDGNGQIEDYDFEYDGGNSSSRLFERSRIRALAGEFTAVLKINKYGLFC